MKARAIAFVAFLLATIAVSSIAAEAQQETPAPPAPYPVVQGKPYKFERIADGVYYATGGVGGNNTIIVNDRDIMIVDDGTTPATARDLLADLKLISTKPVR